MGAAGEQGAEHPRLQLQPGAPAPEGLLVLLRVIGAAFLQLLQPVPQHRLPSLRQDKHIHMPAVGLKPLPVLRPGPAGLAQHITPGKPAGLRPAALPADLLQSPAQAGEPVLVLRRVFHPVHNHVRASSPFPAQRGCRYASGFATAGQRRPWRTARQPSAHMVAARTVASRVWAALWGERIRFGAAHRGLSGRSGSSTVTSSPAPAMVPSRSARTRSASSTMPPRRS